MATTDKADMPQKAEKKPQKGSDTTPSVQRKNKPLDKKSRRRNNSKGNLKPFAHKQDHKRRSGNAKRDAKQGVQKGTSQYFITETPENSIMFFGIPFTSTENEFARWLAKELVRTKVVTEFQPESSKGKDAVQKQPKSADNDNANVVSTMGEGSSSANVEAEKKEGTKALKPFPDFKDPIYEEGMSELEKYHAKAKSDIKRNEFLANFGIHNLRFIYNSSGSCRGYGFFCCKNAEQAKKILTIHREQIAEATKLAEEWDKEQLEKASKDAEKTNEKSKHSGDKKKNHALSPEDYKNKKFFSLKAFAIFGGRRVELSNTAKKENKAADSNYEAELKKAIYERNALLYRIQAYYSKLSEADAKICSLESQQNSKPSKGVKESKMTDSTVGDSLKAENDGKSAVVKGAKKKVNKDDLSSVSSAKMSDGDDNSGPSSSEAEVEGSNKAFIDLFAIAPVEQSPAAALFGKRSSTLNTPTIKRSQKVKQ